MRIMLLQQARRHEAIRRQTVRCQVIRRHAYRRPHTGMRAFSLAGVSPHACGLGEARAITADCWCASVPGRLFVSQVSN